MKKSVIVATSLNRVIGLKNKLPWHLPKDLKRFRAYTLGQTVIMGRTTYESIGKPLRERHNIVLSRTPGYTAPGCYVFHDIESALQSNPPGEVFFIGGQQIYQVALPLADTIYVTLVLDYFEGDAFFPKLDISEWRESEVIMHENDDKHLHRFMFINYERKIPQNGVKTPNRKV